MKKNIYVLLKNPYKILYAIVRRIDILAKNLPDDLYLKLAYRSSMGQKLDLINPVNYNQKLQWLKLHDRNPLYTKLVDKYEVKSIVSQMIGEEYVIPSIGVWDSFDDIDFSLFPNSFVLKCTHDSGSTYVCKNKNDFNYATVRSMFNKALKCNYYYSSREWPYKNVKPRIIAEEYLEDASSHELRDYKFYCFDGVVQATLVATDRMNPNSELCFDYFDSSYKHLELTNFWHPNAKVMPARPTNYDKMIEMASNMSKGFPHVRIDLYECNNKIYFGEFTFYDMGGFLKINPCDWCEEWGSLINLELAQRRKV